MRKLAVGRLTKLILLASTLVAPYIATGQTANQPAAVAIPINPAISADPASFLSKAFDTNGLNGADIKPWHAKISFKQLDEQGQTVREGTFEEFWASPAKFKRTFTSAGFSQTDFGTETKPMRTGSSTPLTMPLANLRRYFFDPLPAKRIIQQFPLTVDGMEVAGIKLVCVAMQWKHTTDQQPSNMARYCFDEGQSTLHTTIGLAGVYSVYSGKSTFQGRDIPLNLIVGKAKKTYLSAHLESIDLLNPISDADFVPPSDAQPIPASNSSQFLPLGPALGFGVPGGTGEGVPGGIPLFGPSVPVTAANGSAIPKQVTISEGVAQGMVLKKIPPTYPPIAKAARIEGTVVLQATISKQGEIEDLKVISGHPMLQQSALDAVKQWTYKPYQFNGEPVEVATTVNVVFQLDPSANPPKKVTIAGGIAQGHLIHPVAPVYPPEAKKAKVSGLVVLQATIGKAGHIEDLRVVSGHPMLQQAAIDAVKQWTYEPYLLNGEPVAVETTINVVFNLGTPPKQPQP